MESWSHGEVDREKIVLDFNSDACFSPDPKRKMKMRQEESK